MTSQVALTLGVFLPNLSRNESHYLDLYWLSYKGLDFLWTRKTRKIRAKQTVSLFFEVVVVVLFFFLLWTEAHATTGNIIVVRRLLLGRHYRLTNDRQPGY